MCKELHGHGSNWYIRRLSTGLHINANQTPSLVLREAGVEHQSGPTYRCRDENRLEALAKDGLARIAPQYRGKLDEMPGEEKTQPTELKGSRKGERSQTEGMHITEHTGK